MEHSEISAWAIEGRTSPIRFRGSQPSANRPVEVGRCSATDARCHQSRPDWQPNLCIVCMRLFGNRPFRRINCECQRVPLWSGSPPSRPTTLCGLPCPSSAVRGTCELTGARVMRGSMPVAQLAPWTTRFLAPKSIVEFLYICTIEARSGCA